MARITILLVAALAAGCASAPDETSVLEKNDAIDDYIHVAELEKVDSIRYFGQLSHKEITEKYIVIYAGKDSYLATYFSNCYDTHGRHLRPDIRHESHTLRAGSDTFRGCRISTLHKIDQGQARELLDLEVVTGEQTN